MPNYVTPARALYGRLSASSAVLSVLTGGVWDKPIERRGPQATAAAFASTPPHRQLPAASISDGGEDGDTAGPRGAFLAFPQVWFYADDDPNGTGRATIETAAALVRSDLDGWWFTTLNGTGVEVRMIGRFGVRTDPTDDSRLVDFLRFQADGVW